MQVNGASLWDISQLKLSLYFPLGEDPGEKSELAGGTFFFFFLARERHAAQGELVSLRRGICPTFLDVLLL